MSARGIPQDVQESAQEVIEHFNRTVLEQFVKYVQRFQGAFLYLDRQDYGTASTGIWRLRYNVNYCAEAIFLSRRSSRRPGK